MNKMIWLPLGALFGLIFVSIAHRRTRDERFLLASGIVIGAWIYVPLAMAGNANTMWLIAEVLVASFFTVIAWAGTRYSIWWLALQLSLTVHISQVSARHISESLSQMKRMKTVELAQPW